MPYHPNIPDANDPPRVSQSELLDNFQKLNTDFSVNHQPLTESLNKGFHTLVQFVNVQGADPNLAAPLTSLYTKAGPVNPELFFQNNNNAASVYQLTNPPIGSSAVNGTHYSFLTPWNIIVKMGRTTALTFLFDATVPFTGSSVIYTALVTGEGTTTQARINSINGAPPTGMTLLATGGTTAYYLVLGSR